MMNQTFGNKREDVTYCLRIGVYLIVLKDNKLAVVRTPKGYFLLGGGIEGKETHYQCLTRECLEEIGFTIEIGSYFGWAQEYRSHLEVGYRHSIQHFYVGKLLSKIQEPVEWDHNFEWLELDKLDYLKVQSQRWVVNQYIRQLGK